MKRLAHLLDRDVLVTLVMLLLGVILLIDPLCLVAHADPLGLGAGLVFAGVLSPGQARVIDPILSNVAQGYRDPGFVGHNLFPSVPVQVSGGQVIEFGAEDFKLYNARRAPGSNTKRVEFGYLGKQYSLFNESLEGKVPDEISRDAARVPGINLGTRAVNKVMKILRRGLEVEQAGVALNATNYDANHKLALSGVTKWTASTGTPLPDIEDGKEAIRASIGIRPNVLLCSAVGFNALRYHASVVDKFKYTTPDSITEEMLARLLRLDRVVVGESIYYDETAAANKDIWGNNAVLAYVALGSMDQEEPSYGYTYTMEGHPMVEEPYRDRNAKSWIYPVTYERKPVLSGMTAAFLFQNPA